MTFIVAVTGGKGGAGKTTVATNLAVALSSRGYRTLLVDADVDNPNDHLYLGVKLRPAMPIKVFTPGFKVEVCTRCGKCNEVCPERLILLEEGKPPMVFEEACNGCKACMYACPVGAIYDRSRDLGVIKIAVRGGLRVVVGELKPTEARSTVAVSKLMKFVQIDVEREKYDYVVIDTSPGVHSSVVQALRPANLAVAITEPTPLGVSTIKLTAQLLSTLGLKWILFINKSTISPKHREEVLEACKEALAVFELPYSEELLKLGIDGKLLVESENPLKQAIMKLTDFIEGLAKIEGQSA